MPALLEPLLLEPLFQPCRAVLFDLDGTLVETHIDFPAMTNLTEALAREAGASPEVTEGKDILGMVDAAVDDLTARGGDGPEWRRQVFGELERLEVEGCAHPVLLPGTQELLAALTANGVKVGVVTRNCRRVAVGLLARFALPHHLLLSRNDVVKSKPNPEHLWDALRLLNARPDEALMVGDHWMDVQAGERAGLAATLGVLGKNNADWFAPCPPTRLAHDLAEAAPLFGLG